MIKTCEKCGKEYNVRGKRKLISKFCSLACRNLDYIGRPVWNKGKKGVMPPVWNKGTKGIVKGYWLGKKRSPEDIEKFRKSHIGNAGFWTGKKRPNIAKENHPRWKGGITPENDKARKSDSYKVWRKACMLRDNFTDRKTGISGGYLVVHHINNFAEFPELRFAIDNGITLSKESHNEFHKKYGRKNNTKEQLDEFLKN